MRSKKRAIISAISVLAVISGFIVPTYYDTELFCSITANAAYNGFCGEPEKIMVKTLHGN